MSGAVRLVPGAARPVDVDREGLRHAIREEYALVAAEPERGFHFHTGRPLARLLGYDEAWLEGLPEPVIASFAGAPNNPAWYNNLVANPVATVEVGSERFQVRATVASGEERQRLFDRQAAQMSIFTDYQKKTSRQIPVLVLTRLD